MHLLWAIRKIQGPEGDPQPTFPASDRPERAPPERHPLVEDRPGHPGAVPVQVGPETSHRFQEREVARLELALGEGAGESVHTY